MQADKEAVEVVQVVVEVKVEVEVVEYFKRVKVVKLKKERSKLSSTLGASLDWAIATAAKANKLAPSPAASSSERASPPPSAAPEATGATPPQEVEARFSTRSS